jgi:cell division protein FtsB
MAESKRFWFLRNWRAWTVLVMGGVTAIVTRLPWILTLGIIGYLLVLLFEASLDPRALVRMASAEQENRSLRAEHSRLVGGIKDLQARNAALEAENQRLTQELDGLKAQLSKPNDQPGSPEL